MPNTPKLSGKTFLLTSHTNNAILLSASHRSMQDMPADKSDILQGTLDLMVLQTLDAMGPQHGYGIARRIEQISEQALQLNQGTIYASLLRLVQQRRISAAWGTSDNNRKAKFYCITRAGRKQLQSETENWQRISGAVARVLRAAVRA
jgi:PadR family transcriptional regulator, regulatory protein PadR